ncbi:MAG: PAS domain S-box protein [Candidatus Nanoarchaeia archaeon]|jgi:PAS domain S-box-containing protein
MKSLSLYNSKKDIASMLKAENKLKEIEERFYNLFEKAPIGILILDNFGKFIDANPKFTEIMGYDKKKFIGKNLLYLSKMLKSDLKKVIGQFSEIVKGKTLGPVEFTLINNKGKKISILCTFSPILQQKQVILLVQDITDNKEIQESLKNSEHSYRRLFEAAQDGVLLLDAKTGMIVDVNPFMINMLGYSKKVFLGKHVWEIGLFKDVFSNKKKFKELQSKKYVRYENLPLETGAGKKINVEFVSNVYYVGDKKVIQCNIRNITLRKEIQDALIKKEEELRTIFDTSPALIIIFDNNQKVIKMNDKILSWLGYNKKEFIGKLLYSLPLTKESKIKSIKEFNEIMKGKKTEPYEVKFISKDNKIKVGLISGKSIIDSKGKVIFYYATISDINEKKELEELKNNLLMLTSHDLKQPLMPILGYADLLKTIITDKKGKKYLSRIIDSSYRMRDMVNKIINVFKIEAGQLTFTITKNDLSKLINEVIDYKTSFGTLKGLKIINHLKKEVTAQFDVERLRDVFVNLLDNAIKFTDKGGTITVKSWTKNNKAYASVKDTGKGLSKEEKDNLFKKFYQSKEAKALGGSGIGLLLVKKIIDCHKGKITVKSVYGKGTEFIVELPRR